MNKIIKGDCLIELKSLKDNSIDSIVTELEKYYDIKTNGIVTSKRTKKKLAFAITHRGYLKARVYCPLSSKHNDKRKPLFLHRIIAMKFLPDYSDTLQVNHINGNKLDNRVENLEMVTNAQNTWHGWNVLDSSKRRLSLINRNYARANK